MRLVRGHLLDGDDVAAVLVVGCDHLLHGAAAEHVGQDHGEGLVADELTGAPDRMAQAERLLLAGEARLPGLRLILGQKLELLGLAAAFERAVELVGDVEMVLDHRLVAAGDEDEVLDPGGARLIDHVLHDGAVDDAQHLLGDSLGCRQEPGAETGDGQNCFADTLH